MHEKLTPAFVRDVEVPSTGRKFYWDTATASFGLMVTCKGARSFVGDYRNDKGVKRRKTWPARIGKADTGLSLDEARREFRKVVGDAERGRDPVQEEREQRERAKEERRKAEAAITTTVKAVLEDYLSIACGMKRDADGNAILDENDRTTEERLGAFERFVYPQIGTYQIDELKRSRIVKMLDKIAADNGPVQADRTLAYLRAAFNWYAARSDDWASPIVRGMARTKPRQRARKRDLNDEEIRDLWAALDRAADRMPPCYPTYVRTLLLTALRRTECSRGSWPEIAMVYRENLDGFRGRVWTVPKERMKNNLDHAVPLTAAVLTLIGARPRDELVKERPYLFSTGDGKRPFSGYSKAKKVLDDEITTLREEEGRAPMPQWQLHDLRRTAKTLMLRQGVRPDVTERVLSHVIPGVEGVYDCYEYLGEKLDALTKLATLIERVLNPPTDNIVSFQKEA
jgi:integrase